MSLLNKIFDKKIEPIVLNGYYKHTLLLNNTDKSKGTDTYITVVHVSELERYKGDLSKIKLECLEVESGINVGQYEYIKQCSREQFVSIKKTSDITWLEPIVTLKDERKEKLKTLNKL